MRYLLLPRFILAALLSGLTACQGTFVPDPVDPRLPRISSEGADAAGAFVNGQRWSAVRVGGWSNGDGLEGNLWLSVDSTQRTVRMTIDGQLETRPGEAGDLLQITFILDNADGRLDQFTGLRGQTFALDGPHRAVVAGPFWQEEGTVSESSRTGQLYIHSLEPVQKDLSVSYYLAGTFSFVIDCTGCTPYDVQSGRFDYEVEGYTP